MVLLSIIRHLGVQFHRTSNSLACRFENSFFIVPKTISSDSFNNFLNILSRYKACKIIFCFIKFYIIYSFRLDWVVFLFFKNVYLLPTNKEFFFLKLKYFFLYVKVSVRIHIFQIVFVLNMCFMKLSSRILYELHEVGDFFLQVFS